MTRRAAGKTATKAGREAPSPALTSLAALPGEQLTGEHVPAGIPAEMFTAAGMIALADVLPIMTAYVDRDERVRFVNRPMAEYLEQPRLALLGCRLREMLGEDTYAARKPLIDATFAGERQFFVAEFDHPSRGSTAIQAEYVPWAGPDGAVDGIIMLVKDVTEQRTAERALKESEARFRRIANSAPALMWVTRLDRVRDFVNDAYAEFACGPGCDLEQARKLDWRERIHPDDVERVVAESLAGEATLKRFTLEARYRRHDGEYRWLRTVSQPRFGPNRELVGFIGVGTDITLAKDAELELLRQVEEQTREISDSEARFRAVFDTVLEVLVLMKPDGTVVELNSKQAVWRAENAREAVGLKMWDAPTLRLYPQQVALLKLAVKQAARGEMFNQEVSLDREGAATAHLDVSVQPVRNAAGKVIYLLFEARDITELKAAQEQLRQSQKMEALGQLTGGIAHDFNNLLTVVVGGLDIVAKRAIDDKLRHYAENALAAAERGARLTGQLLAFSRVQRLEVRPTCVAPLIENMRPLLRNVLGPGVQKRFELDQAVIPVMADPTQLEVAVLNLAINARDAMPDGGTLTFASQWVRVTADAELEDGDYLALTVSDTGSGMQRAVRERAFEPFFTTKEVGKGTGLGLSMVYGMARQSGGSARIESTPGQGTAVTLLFRKADEATDERGPHGDDSAPRRGAGAASILVIDDDPDVREFIAAALEELGYRVRQAADGHAGLAETARERPDLVILDFIMPGMSGADAASRILADHPDQPILFVSGYSETGSIKSIAPNAPLLAKPFRADSLDKAVRSALAAKG